MNKNIVLIGMPGCGKTTVGTMLAEQLGFSFLDVDEEIVKTEGKIIPDIFKDQGEAYFREAEHREIKRAMEKQGFVIATGGGCVTNPKNYEPLHQNSIVIFLDRDIHSLPTDGRPVSQRDGVQKIYETRLPLYLSWKTEGYHIKCPNSAKKTAQLILDMLKA